MAGKNEANLADKKTPEKPKRGQYKEKECPRCHAMPRNLGNHINKDKSNDKNEDNTGISEAIMTLRVIKKKRTRMIIEAKKTNIKQKNINTVMAWGV